MNTSPPHHPINPTEFWEYIGKQEVGKVNPHGVRMEFRADERFGGRKVREVTHADVSHWLQQYSDEVLPPQRAEFRRARDIEDLRRVGDTIALIEAGGKQIADILAPHLEAHFMRKRERREG